MKTAIVTGAAQGVGFATSLLLAKAGYRVVMVDLQALDAPLAQLRAACGVVGAAAGVAAAGVAAAGVAAAGVAAAGAAAIGVSGDVSSAPFVENLAGRVAAEFGAADVLCNNAGVSLIARAEQTSLAQWQRVLDINLTGPFLLCKAIGAQMLSRQAGRGVAPDSGVHANRGHLIANSWIRSACRSGQALCARSRSMSTSIRWAWKKPYVRA
jgi:NAD(P)-dependent dehydrogenase (short-subunit alcohol dehydrogenase family)